MERKSAGLHNEAHYCTHLPRVIHPQSHRVGRLVLFCYLCAKETGIFLNSRCMYYAVSARERRRRSLSDDHCFLCLACAVRLVRLLSVCFKTHTSSLSCFQAVHIPPLRTQLCALFYIPASHQHFGLRHILLSTGCLCDMAAGIFECL
jgi:hypothetical protein